MGNAGIASFPLKRTTAARSSRMAPHANQSRTACPVRARTARSSLSCVISAMWRIILILNAMPFASPVRSLGLSLNPSEMIEEEICYFKEMVERVGKVGQCQICLENEDAALAGLR